MAERDHRRDGRDGPGGDRPSLDRDPTALAAWRRVAEQRRRRQGGDAPVESGGPDPGPVGPASASSIPRRPAVRADDGSTSTASRHDLLLAMAGRLDDDALGTVRELVAVDDAAAAEMLGGCLLADRVAVTGDERRQLASWFAGVRVDPDLLDALPGDDEAPRRSRHRFLTEIPGVPTDDGEAVARAAARLTGVTGVGQSWRVTPAGRCPGPLPHRVVLVETAAVDDREHVAHHVGHAARALGAVSVEVYAKGARLPAYQRDAVEAARALAVGDTPSRPALPSSATADPTGDALPVRRRPGAGSAMFAPLAASREEPVLEEGRLREDEAADRDAEGWQVVADADRGVAARRPVSPWAELPGSELYGPDRSDVAGSDVAGSDVAGSDVAGSDVAGSDLAGSDLAGSAFHGAGPSGVDLYGADLHGADLHGADLHGADLHGSDLTESDPSGADLTGAAELLGPGRDTRPVTEPEVPADAPFDLDPDAAAARIAALWAEPSSVDAFDVPLDEGSWSPNLLEPDLPEPDMAGEMARFDVPRPVTGSFERVEGERATRGSHRHAADSGYDELDDEFDAAVDPAPDARIQRARHSRSSPDDESGRTVDHDVRFGAGQEAPWSPSAGDRADGAVFASPVDLGAPSPSVSAPLPAASLPATPAAGTPVARPRPDEPPTGPLAVPPAVVRPSGEARPPRGGPEPTGPAGWNPETEEAVNSQLSDRERDLLARLHAELAARESLESGEPDPFAAQPRDPRRFPDAPTSPSPRPSPTPRTNGHAHGPTNGHAHGPTNGHAHGPTNGHAHGPQFGQDRPDGEGPRNGHGRGDDH